MGVKKIITYSGTIKTTLSRNMFDGQRHFSYFLHHSQLYEHLHGPVETNHNIDEIHVKFSFQESVNHIFKSKNKCSFLLAMLENVTAVECVVDYW